MILAVHSNASYFSESNARSRVGGHFFMSSDATIPPVGNRAIIMVTQIVKHVISSVAEAELTALYINTCKVVYI